MKKLFVLMLVVSLASVASAGLKISVDGVVDPMDTEITLKEGQTAVIDIWGDGATASPHAPWLFVSGPGSINGSDMVYTGSLALYQDAESAAADAGMGEDVAGFIEMMAGAVGLADVRDLSFITLADGAVPPAALDGTLVDGIIFKCEGLGDVTLTLLAEDLATVLDTQVIHQIPEPMTLALLGLGGLFLRRRK